MSSKKINETSSAAGGSAWGAFPHKVKKEVKVKIAAVYPPGKNKKSKTPYKMAVIEKKSERALREAVRNLIFLNKVKYHEEQVRREIQEQKIRRVVRYLLNEANKSTPIQMTTGENNALNFLNNVRSTTFEQLYAQLSSDQKQREAFKTTYKEKIKLYLDSLDQQHIILNPEDNPSNNQEQNTVAEPAAQEAAPKDQQIGDVSPEQQNLAEADGMGGGVPLSGLNTVSDTSHIQSQVLVTKLSRSDLHPTGVQQALKALGKDLPQIDDLYNILTFKPLQMPSGEITSDRGAFRKMLIGSMENSGAPGTRLQEDNLDINFDTIDKNTLTSDKKKENAAPAEQAPVPTGTSQGEPAQLSEPITPEDTGGPPAV